MSFTEIAAMEPKKRAALNRAPSQPVLKRDMPLVPVTSIAGRDLVTVVAILTFLAALAAGAARIVAHASMDWRSSISREATIQIRPQVGGNIEDRVQRAAALARADGSIESVRVYDKSEAERLLEPWLGSGLNLADLPVPRLIVLRLKDPDHPEFGPLKAALVEQVPGASLDDHRLWVQHLSSMANTMVALGLLVVALVLTAAGLAVGFATRGAMASNRDIVEVLHFVGADDAFVARQFQVRFLRLGLKGGAIGSSGALVLMLVCGFLSSWGTGAGGDQVQALFGSFGIGLADLCVVIAIAILVSGIAALVSRTTVRNQLRELM